MVTYYFWKVFLEEITIYSTTADKIGTYSIASFLSTFSIIADILTFPFQLAGVLIYIITNIKK